MLNKILFVIAIGIIPVLHIEPFEFPHSGQAVGVRSYITDAPIRASADKPEKEKLEKFKITAYCPCEECSEGYGRNTSTGVLAEEGRTIAVDPSVIPYGTKVHINGMGDFIAEDCGGRLRRNILTFTLSNTKIR